MLFSRGFSTRKIVAPRKIECVLACRKNDQALSDMTPYALTEGYSTSTLLNFPEINASRKGNKPCGTASKSGHLSHKYVAPAFGRASLIQAGIPHARTCPPEGGTTSTRQSHRRLFRLRGLCVARPEPHRLKSVLPEALRALFESTTGPCRLFATACLFPP